MQSVDISLGEKFQTERPEAYVSAARILDPTNFGAWISTPFRDLPYKVQKALMGHNKIYLLASVIPRGEELLSEAREALWAAEVKVQELREVVKTWERSVSKERSQLARLRKQLFEPE
jgi:hypothetical protein